MPHALESASIPVIETAEKTPRELTTFRNLKPPLPPSSGHLNQQLPKKTDSTLIIGTASAKKNFAMASSTLSFVLSPPFR